MENQYRYYLDNEVDNIHWVLTKNYLGNTDSDLVMKFYTFLSNMSIHFREINVRYVGNETDEKAAENGSESLSVAKAKVAGTKGLATKFNQFWPRTNRSAKMMNAKLSNSITIDSDPQVSESSHESSDENGGGGAGVIVDYRETFRKQCRVRLVRENLEELRKKCMRRKRRPKNYLEVGALLSSSSSAIELSSSGTSSSSSAAASSSSSSSGASSTSSSDSELNATSAADVSSAPGRESHARHAASKASFSQIVTSDSGSSRSPSRARSRKAASSGRPGRRRRRHRYSSSGSSFDSNDADEDDEDEEDEVEDLQRDDMDDEDEDDEDRPSSASSSSEKFYDAISNLENVEFKKRTVNECRRRRRRRGRGRHGDETERRKKPKKKSKVGTTATTSKPWDGPVPNLARRQVQSETDEDTESFYDSEVEKLSASETCWNDVVLDAANTGDEQPETVPNGMGAGEAGDTGAESDGSGPLSSLDQSPVRKKRVVNGTDAGDGHGDDDDDDNGTVLDENQNKRKRGCSSAGETSDANTDASGDKENEPETAASWRNDPLARLRLDENSDCKSAGGAGNGAVEGRRKRRVKRKRAEVSSDDDDDDDDDGNSDGNDSDYARESLKKRRKKILDDTTSEEESSAESTYNDLPNRQNSVKCNGNGRVVGAGSGNKLTAAGAANGPAGDNTSEHAASRRNIRKIIKDKDLQRSTKLMIDAEKKRIERLKAKRKWLQTCLKSYDFQKRRAILACDSKTYKPLVQIDRKFMETLKDHQVDGIRFMWESCFEDLELGSAGAVEQENEDGESIGKRAGTGAGTGGSGCILAHYMGLGKTFQVVALVHALFAQKDTNITRVIVVCPVTTLHSWHQEFLSKFRDAYRKVDTNVYKLIGRNAVDHIKSWWQHKGVMLVSYEMLSSLFGRTAKADDSADEQLKRAYDEYLMHTDLIVCDEGHYIKNITNLRSQALLKVRTRRRILLTGTPIQNNLSEYFWMVNFVKPNYLGSFDEFTNRFMNPIKNGQYENSTAQDIGLMKKRSYVLHKMLKETVQRMNSDLLRKYLPPKYDHVLYVHMSPLQRTLYNKFLDIVESRLPLAEASDYVPTKNAFFFNHQVMRLIWTHPYCLVLRSQETETQNLLIENVSDNKVLAKQEDIIKVLLQDVPVDELEKLKNGTKMKILIQIVKEAINHKEKTIIFSSSRLELTCIEYFLEKSLYKYNLDYIRIDGRNTITDRQRLFANFCKASAGSRLKILVCSKKVGGVGLTLLPANRVVLMDVEWNPADDQQAVYRIYRFGQTKPAYIYRLVPNRTMEQIIYERSITKMAVSHRVIDERQINRHFNSADLENVYRRVPDVVVSVPRIRLTINDPVLQKIAEGASGMIAQLKDHRSLLENVPDEELNDEERRIAWEEYESSIQTPALPPASVANGASDGGGGGEGGASSAGNC